MKHIRTRGFLKALICLFLGYCAKAHPNDVFDAQHFTRDKRYQDLAFLWNQWHDAYLHQRDFFSLHNAQDLERILQKQWKATLSSSQTTDHIHAGIPLAMVYHNQAKFKQGLPVLEYLYQHLQDVPSVYWKALLVKLEEEYRGENLLEKAIPIRRKRIELGYINTFWEIYWECGLVDEALRDFLQNQPKPAYNEYNRLFYMQRLGWLYTDHKDYVKAYQTYQLGFNLVKEVRKSAGAHYLPRELGYWEGAFQGNMAQCMMAMGNYQGVIPKLRYDIDRSMDNPDNKIGKMISLGDAYLHFGQLKQAKMYFDSSAILLAPKVIRPFKLRLLQSFESYYAKIGRFDQAYRYKRAFQVFQDSLNIKTNHNKSILMLGQLELAKNRADALRSKQQVAFISETAKWQNFTIKSLIILLVVVVLGVILLYYYFRQKGVLLKNQIQLGIEHERNAVLLKELHHRVKNNLQVIYSLLNLQKRRTANPESVDLILALQNRIQTIALVHNNLFQTDEMEFVQLSEYLRTLVEHLHQMYAVDEQRKVTIVWRVDEHIKVRFERIATLGLIINEIVSNAFKYAFAQVDAGVLSLEVRQMDQEIEICVEDNGRGKVEEIRQNAHLGMRLIQILCDQMDAQYELAQGKGIKHCIKFKL